MDARTPAPGMNAARIANSPRLQRLLRILVDGREHTTLQLIREAEICAVNSAAAELRANGVQVSCRRRGPNYYYKLGHPA